MKWYTFYSYFLVMRIFVKLNVIHGASELKRLFLGSHNRY